MYQKAHPHLIEFFIAVQHYLCLLLLLQCLLTHVLFQQCLQVLLWHCLACMHAAEAAEARRVTQHVCVCI